MNKSLILVTFGLFVGAGAAWAFAPKYLRSIGADARNLLGMSHRRPSGRARAAGRRRALRTTALRKGRKAFAA